jgi:hypothetical protein
MSQSLDRLDEGKAKLDAYKSKLKKGETKYILCQ